MHAHKRTLSEILSSDIRLVAPLFQRPYVWNREDNWEPLWNSVAEVAKRRVEGRTPRPYFLGAVVLDKLHGSIGTVPSREIIDGQQRMTTLQLLMETAKRLFDARGLEHSARRLERITRNELEDDDDQQFKVWPTNLDRDAFRRVMKGEASTGRFAEASAYFQEAVGTWLGNDPEAMKTRATALVDAVRQDLVFVAIDLDNDDDGQLIFETLNSLGTPLLPSDLVKNLLFREAAATGLDTEKLYRQHWLEFEQDADYWRAKTAVGRRERPRLDLFLQYYLTYRLTGEVVQMHQFRDYRDAFREGFFGSTQEALADFHRLARFFHEFDNAKSGAAGSLRHVLDILDASVPNPLVLGIYDNAASAEERDDMLRIVESYLIRRFLCGLTTKNLNRVTTDLIVHLRENGWSAEALRARLLMFEGNSTRWPDDGFVVWRQKASAAYGDIRGTGIAYVLSRVEASLRTGKSECAWNVRTPLTLEHIMPQRWEEHWPLPEEAGEEARPYRDSLLNRIGNLTILTKKLNSSLSNREWKEKRGHLNEHTVLLMNSALAAKEEWNEAEIEARCEDLGHRFCKLWPA
jgi:hypothetical protein